MTPTLDQAYKRLPEKLNGSRVSTRIGHDASIEDNAAVAPDKQIAG
jgi:hypothetical protein